MGLESQLSIRFFPQRWGELERFAYFHFETYPLKRSEAYALNGAANNFKKAVLLSNLAGEIVPKIKEDKEELEKYGASRAIRSRQYTAIVEAEITSLYSSLNCTCKVLLAVFPNAQGLPTKTRKLFQNAVEGKIDETVPVAIREALASATWYSELRLLRDALTHTNTGHCHMDAATGRITYFHDSLRGQFKNGVLEDFPDYVNQLLTKVNQFLGAVYRALNLTLNSKEVQTMCGAFGGRIYMRLVRPQEVRDFGSGRCFSHTWFDQPGQPRCPLTDQCDAYNKRELLP